MAFSYSFGVCFFFLKKPEFSDTDHTSLKVRIKLARWNKRSLHCQRPGWCHPRTDLGLELLCATLVFSSG